MDTIAFQRQLAAIITWCRTRFDLSEPIHSLRSLQLAPSIGLTEAVYAVAIQRAVKSVGDRRTSMLGNLDDCILPLSGRLFAFYPERSICDGVSDRETNGFIDGNNTPAWDSWVCVVDELLISWVPPAMIEDVELAVTCNVEECMCWLSDITNSPFVDELREHQLVW